MNIEEFRNYCLSKKAVEESFPFGEQTLVFKVMGKMFALTNLDREEAAANLKCDPERATQLRSEYDAVQAGYHMNKKHWNTILLESNMADDLLYELIDHSYELVIKNLPKKTRETLGQL